MKKDLSHTIITLLKEVRHMANNNSLVVQGAQQALDAMKYEIATEFGVTLGPDSTSRANGSVGGEITKRLVQMAEQSLHGFSK
jgi:hypothetical protein